MGFTADRVMKHGKHGRGGRPSIDRMAKELKLTPAQRVQFDSITNRRREQMRALWQPLRPQMDSLSKLGKVIGDSTHEQLKRILNPEQARKLDEMRERGRKRAQAHGRDKGRNKSTQTP